MLSATSDAGRQRVIERIVAWASTDVKPRELSNIKIALLRRFHRDPIATRDALMEAMAVALSEATFQQADPNHQINQICKRLFADPPPSFSQQLHIIAILPVDWVSRLRFGLDRIGHHGRRHCVSLDLGREASATQHHPSDALIREEQIALLHLAVSTLPSAYQNIIALQLAGLRPDQIASVLNTSRSSVYRWHSAALLELSRRLPADMLQE